MIGIKYKDGKLEVIKGIDIRDMEYTLLNSEIDTIIVVDEKTKEEKQFVEVDMIK